jgi:hypothetical protein
MMTLAPSSFVARVCVVGCAFIALSLSFACAGKVVPYPEDHERFVRIDKAVESLREAYQRRDRSGLRDVMLPVEQLEQMQADAEQDFDTFQSIQLEFKTERIMIDGENIDVYVHWQGAWKKTSEDAGIRQRGHARLQWVGTQSILLRGVQGDLPFGMKTRQALSELPISGQKSPK